MPTYVKVCALILLAVLVALTAALITVLADSQTGSIVSNGADYSLLPGPSAAYPDGDPKLLTDGAHGQLNTGASGYYSGGAYVGFNSSALDQSGEITVIIDLGKRYEDLCAFSLGYLNEVSVGVFAPESVSFSVADSRNGDYEQIGVLNTKQDVAGTSETYVSTLSCDPVAGRYVKVTVKALVSYTDAEGVIRNAGWTFLDEISVYSASGEAPGGAADVSDTSEESGTADQSGGNRSPKTGDESVSYAVLALAAVSALAMGVALFAKRRRGIDSIE